MTAYVFVMIIIILLGTSVAYVSHMVKILSFQTLAK